MKNLFIVFLLALGGFYMYDANTNRKELESARMQIQQLTQERDQAAQKLKQLGYAPQQASSSETTNWFQKRLQEKSALDPTNSSGKSGHR